MEAANPKDKLVFLKLLANVSEFTVHHSLLCMGLHIGQVAVTLCLIGVCL